MKAATRMHALPSLAAFTIVAVAAATNSNQYVNGAFAHGNSLGRSMHAHSKTSPDTFGTKRAAVVLQADPNEKETTRDVDSAETTEALSNKASGSGTWNPLRLAILKLGMTELRFTSPLNYEKRDGSYNCADCGTALFDATGKYDSGSGWPSFWRTAEGNVALFRELDGRIECRCNSCGGHLGHVFPDGPRRSDVSPDVLEEVPEQDLSVGSSPGSMNFSRLPRYCMNGASLKFHPRE